jgi:hypothetical protein
MSHVFGFTLLLVLTLAALPGAPARSAPAPAALDREFMGMVIRDPWYDFGTNPNYPNAPNQDFQDTMGATLAQAGVRWVRLDFHIYGNDPISEIAKNDYFIDEVAPRNNLKILALLSFDLLQGVDAHDLNCTKPECMVSGSIYGGGVNQYMDTWLTRALLIADRYRDKIAAYEILNEENRLPRYIPGGPVGDAIAPEISARLLTKFYRFCKNIDPSNQNHGCGNAQIILGGIHPRGSNSPTNPNQIVKTDTDYLTQVYDIANPSSPFKSFSNTYHRGYPVDGIGYHPYPQEIRLSINDVLVNRGIQRMRQALGQVGDPYKQFWITEVGYNVGFDVDGSRNPIPPQTDIGQEYFLRDVYTTLAARQLDNGAPEIANVFWFKYEDFPPESGPSAQKWGVVRIPFASGDCPGGACYDLAGTPSLYRPSFWAYRDLAGLPVYRVYFPVAGS